MALTGSAALRGVAAAPVRASSTGVAPRGAPALTPSFHAWSGGANVTAPVATTIGRRQLRQQDIACIEFVNGYGSKPLLELGDLPIHYWSRPSPRGSAAGNLYAVGTAGDSGDGDGLGVVVFDLAGSGNRTRIGGMSSYDPTFNADGLVVHQGGRHNGSAIFIPNARLKEAIANNELITPDSPGIVSVSDEVNAYQDVGGNMIIWPDEWQADPGTSSDINRQDPMPNFTERSVLNIATLVDGQMGPREGIVTPFHGDWQMDTNGTRVLARTNHPDTLLQAGYKLYAIVPKSAGNSSGPFDFESESFGLAKLADIPDLRGGKSQVSGNLVVAHHAAEPSDRAHYGNLNDTQFEALLEAGTSDLYVHDLTTNTTSRATNVGPGAFAKYGDFRVGDDGRLELMWLRRNADDTSSVMTSKRF